MKKSTEQQVSHDSELFQRTDKLYIILQRRPTGKVTSATAHGRSQEQRGVSKEQLKKSFCTHPHYHYTLGG